MPRKNNHKKEKLYFTNCENKDCGKYPAMWRWFNGKVLCSECATSAFIKYLAALGTGTAVLWMAFG